MARRHSHSGHKSDDDFNWFTDALTPYYLKKGYNPKPQVDMPPVEPETPEQMAEREKVETPSVHQTLQERYDEIMEGS